MSIKGAIGLVTRNQRDAALLRDIAAGRVNSVPGEKKKPRKRQRSLKHRGILSGLRVSRGTS